MDATKTAVSDEWSAYASLHDTLNNIAIGLRLTVEACDFMAEKRREGVEVDYFSGNPPDERVVVRCTRPIMAHDHVVHELKTAVQCMEADWLSAVWDNLRPALESLDGIPSSLQADLDVAAGTRWVIGTRRVLNFLISSPSPYRGFLSPPPEQAGFPRDVSEAVYVCNHGLKRDDWRRHLGELQERISQLSDCQPAGVLTVLPEENSDPVWELEAGGFRFRGGDFVSLGKSALAVLRVFVDHPRRHTFGYSDLKEAWGELKGDTSDDAVRIAISDLRKELVAVATAAGIPCKDPIPSKNSSWSFALPR